MKYLSVEALDTLPGKRIRAGENFSFSCHGGLSCFNVCCRNLNLYLYPYDVLMLCKALNLSSDDFLDRHTDVVMRTGEFFPEVLLRMADNEEKTCPFLTDQGCSVYSHRPDTCRTFPVEQGTLFGPDGKVAETVAFFRPPDFCMGRHESRVWTLDSWAADQEAEKFNRMTREWGFVRGLFAENPWGSEGFYGRKGKMAFMAAYHADLFRSFVFGSSFFKRYKIHPDLKRKLKKDDVSLLRFGFDWIRHSVWGMDVKSLQLKK
ncbi:YkgJ family cysteine cluster protein [Desulfobotulus sp. H1]|uniref:YkgJ family cysteine cluster protein n=1 Tax=Desulfobotulus pelophilus TaxID=2823377 RepID=A0ABT3NCI6_9BACT|nr:YkgJ family cysteine cluster protein [Desulfobotulus pelophilus]MCW7755167.1 YkgJ family cysteine cluster protein [Desulfobotulus pelophilus]